MAGKPCIESAMQHFRAKAASCELFLGHGYILMVSSVMPWHSATDLLLQEDLILAAPGSCAKPDIRAVWRFFERYGFWLGCTGLLVGNSYQDPRLTSIYKRRGFQHVTDVLYKRIDKDG
jgi:hypothetical protein